MRYQRSALLASACAYALGMAAANAQNTAPANTTQTATALEEVVVTGSFIPTLPEDAATPVEVINYEDLQNLGRPSNMDLIKNLTSVGQSIGELDRNNAYPIDAATINLRNLGPRFTTVVLNNRRFPEQFSPAVGRFNNINSIPNAVIGSVEVLKSGGAAIYGADAVAGVVNYITRKNVEALEISADYRQIPDSDGDYSLDSIWGTKFDGGNFLISASYQHRSRLDDRDFSHKQYLENPVGWSAFVTPGAYSFQSPAGANLSPTVGVGQRQRGLTGVVRDPACQPLGGFAGLSATGSPVCYMDLANWEPLVEENDQYSIFSEFNKTFAGLDFHLEGLANYRETPHASVATRGAPLTFPMLGTPIAAGASAGLYDRVLFGTTAAYSTTGANPAVRRFLENQFYNQDNVTPAFSTANINTIRGVDALGNPVAAGPGRVGLLNTIWSPFGVGGSPLGPDFDYQRNTTTQYRLSGSLGGGIPSFLGTEFEWEVALTYHWTKDTRWAMDIPTHKLQNALNGFGGPGCTQNPMPGGGGTPGAPGCFYFNPFSSAFASSELNGAANPLFVGSGDFTGYVPGTGLQNNPDMVRFLYEPISLARTYRNTVVDPIIRGSTGIDLPGGAIQLAIGGQFRRQDEEVDISDNVDRSINPCPFLPNGQRLTAPGLNPATNQYTVSTSAFTGTQNACTGAMALSRSLTILGSQANNHRDERRHFPVAAAFLQFKLPILSNLNADIVGRYEKFFSDVTDVDNDVFVPAVALKWDITDWVSVRGSYGETFSQVNPPEELPPVPANGTVPANVAYTTFNYPNLEVKPETAQNFSVGFVFQSGDFTATLDYNAITIQNYTRSLTAGNIATALLLPGESITNVNALINCSSPLLTQSLPGLGNNPYALLSAACVQGSRNANPLLAVPGSQFTNTATGAAGSTGAGGQLLGGSINFFGGQGQTNSGELVSNALDVAMSYRFNALGGFVMPSINATYVTKYEFEDWYVQGVKIADGYDGVGYRNGTTGRLLQGVPEYRLGFSLLYSMDKHTVNISTRFIPSVINEDPTDFTASTARNANIGPNTSVGCPATASLTSYLGHVPAGAGTGEFGTTCAGYVTAPLAGTKIGSYFNVDLVYRVQVTDNLEVSVNILNLTDEDPSFARTQLSYDAGYGSPLGRTIELSAGFKF